MSTKDFDAKSVHLEGNMLTLRAVGGRTDFVWHLNKVQVAHLKRVLGVTL